MHPAPLILKRASTSRPSGQWTDDDYDVFADNAVVGRIVKVHAAPLGTPWMWTLAYGYHEDRTPTHGYAATCEDAMAAFAQSWRRELWPYPPGVTVLYADAGLDQVGVASNASTLRARHRRFYARRSIERAGADDVLRLACRGTATSAKKADAKPEPIFMSIVVNFASRHDGKSHDGDFHRRPIP